MYMENAFRFLILILIVIVAILFARKIVEELVYRSNFNKLSRNVIVKVVDYMANTFDVVCFDFSGTLVDSAKSKLLRRPDWKDQISNIDVPNPEFLRILWDKFSQYSDKHIVITTKNNNGRGIELVLQQAIGPDFQPIILYGRGPTAMDPERIPHNRIDDRLFIGNTTKLDMFTHLSEWYQSHHAKQPRMLIFDDQLFQIWTCIGSELNCQGVITNSWVVQRNFDTRSLWNYWRYLYEAN